MVRVQSTVLFRQGASLQQLILDCAHANHWWEKSLCFGVPYIPQEEENPKADLTPNALNSSFALCVECEHHWELTWHYSHQALLSQQQCLGWGQLVGCEMSGPILPAEPVSQPQEPMGLPSQGYWPAEGLQHRCSVSAALALLLPVFLSTGNLLQDNLWDTMGSFLHLWNQNFLKLHE